MGLFRKTKSHIVMLLVTPHCFKGHPDHVGPLFKKVGVDVKNLDDYRKCTQGQGGRWVTQYIIFLPSHFASKLLKVNSKKGVFRSVDVKFGVESYVKRQYPELIEEQKAFIKPN